MKALIATACVAILAFVGYFFWGEYSKSKAAAELADRRDTKVYCSELDALVQRTKHYDLLTPSTVDRCGEVGHHFEARQ